VKGTAQDFRPAQGKAETAGADASSRCHKEHRRPSTPSSSAKVQVETIKRRQRGDLHDVKAEEEWPLEEDSPAGVENLWKKVS